MMELSKKNSQQMKSVSPNPTDIDYLKAGKKSPKKNTDDKRSKFEARKYTAHSSNSSTNSDVKTNVKCFRCGKPHLVTKCTLSKDVRCHGCGKLGHLRTVCFIKGFTNQLQEILSLKHVSNKYRRTIEINSLLRSASMKNRWNLNLTAEQRLQLLVSRTFNDFFQGRPFITLNYN